MIEVIALTAVAALVLSSTREQWLPKLDALIKSVRLWMAAGREGRKELRESEFTARELLRTCLDKDSWEMYRDLGFVRVWGKELRAPAPAGRRPAARVSYAYLIYPRRPIVVYLPQTATLLGEFHFEFDGIAQDSQLSSSDDLLAHWMALNTDEPGVLACAHIGTPGMELSRRHLHRDLWRLREWEQGRSQNRSGEPLAQPAVSNVSAALARLSRRARNRRAHG